MKKLTTLHLAALLALGILPAAAETSARDVIKPGDILSLTVYNELDLSFDNQRVDQEGAVTIPLLGRVQLAGKSVQQANRDITEAFAKDYLVNPDVTLNIVGYGEYQTITVLGTVTQPGQVSFAKGEWIDAIRAIERAGGLSNPDSSTLTVKRRGAPDTSADILMIRTGKQSRLTLRDGDILIVGG